MSTKPTSHTAAGLARGVPAFGWPQSYQPGWLRGDVIAGIRLQAVEARSAMRDRLRNEGVEEQLGGINRFTSVADAVEEAQKPTPTRNGRAAIRTNDTPPSHPNPHRAPSSPPWRSASSRSASLRPGSTISTRIAMGGSAGWLGNNKQNSPSP